MNLNAEETIEAVIVPEEQRLDFLPKHTKRAFLSFERLAYDFMGKLCRQYKGGYWEFVELSNGGFFMYPRLDSDMKLEWVENYSEETVSPQAAGITACLFALNYLSGAYSRGDDVIIEKYHLLYEYATQHPEWAKILRLID